MSKKRKDDRVIDRLETFGAKVYLKDLDDHELSYLEVLEETDNKGGFDLTTRKLEDPHRRNFYDWLCYEILSYGSKAGVKHIFLPVGTGDLFANMIAVIHDEVSEKKLDRRRMGATIEDVNVYGATTYFERTEMDKLYAKFRPTLVDVKARVIELQEQKSLGPESGVFEVGEEITERAFKIAKDNKIRAGRSACAGLALFLQKKEEKPLIGMTVIVNSGWMYLPHEGFGV